LTVGVLPTTVQGSEKTGRQGQMVDFEILEADLCSIFQFAVAEAQVNPFAGLQFQVLNSGPLFERHSMTLGILG